MNAELWHRIRTLHDDEGLSIRAISRRLEVHRRTVREALRSARPSGSQRARRGSIVDPYRGWLLAKLSQFPELTAVRLFAMLRDQGYQGGYSLVKQCVADLRPRLKPAYLTLHFAPGECAQVDWGVWKALDVPGGRRRLSFFVMVLAHSRMMYAEFSFGQAMEHWLSAHRNAFEFFGGVPENVMVDNCKTAVITPGVSGYAPVFNPAYLDFSRHYGFRISPCNVRRPNEKGRVENGVGYIKTAFLAGREPAPVSALAPALAHWLETTANVRTHGATGRRPVDLFVENEREALGPLPAGPFDCCVTQPVVANNRFRITVDGNRYSVPSQYASRRLQLHTTADRIAVYTPEGALVADHPRCYGRRQDVLDPDHERDLRLRMHHSRDRRRIETFFALGTAAKAYLDGLREKRPNWRGHIDRINALAEIYGRDQVARLLADALEHHAFSSEYVLNILEARKRLRPEPGPLHVTRRKDLLDLKIPKPDLTVYDPRKRNKEPHQ